MATSNNRIQSWQPLPHPEWLEKVNGEGDAFLLNEIVPLDAESLLASARRLTGLTDFGDDYWREPFQVLTEALQQESQLTLMGRLVTRNDLLLWLRNRLEIEALCQAHPEIEQTPVTAPVFIAGLPRSGTSILYELLAQDPRFRVPASWEALFPCPLPDRAPGDPDPRHEQAHQLVTQWGRLAPEYQTMHEMGADIPCECGMLIAHTFVSDHIAALIQSPSYHALLAQADMEPVYRYHKRVLQVLQWRRPGQHWLLKAPAHLSHLETLFKVYPDARVIHTHRDPIKSMASATSLLGTLYWTRSDQHFEASVFEDLMLGEATAARLNRVIQQREDGVLPTAQVTDSRYQDLIDDPEGAVARLYQWLGLSFGAVESERVHDYLEHKPKGKHGKHHYTPPSAEQIARERPLFADYQRRYNIPDEL